MKNKQLLMDLTDEQCEKVVGGVGSDVPAGAGGAGAGTVGWDGSGSTGLRGSGPFSAATRGIITVGNGTVHVPFVSVPADPFVP